MTYLTIEQAAEVLRMSTAQLRKLAVQRRIGASPVCLGVLAADHGDAGE